jgi:hypothetical protein
MYKDVYQNQGFSALRGKSQPPNNGQSNTSLLFLFNAAPGLFAATAAIVVAASC